MRVLEFGAQPADEPAPLLGRALGVQRHQAFQNLFVAEVVRPAVGIEDGGVQIVVQLLEHRHQALLVDDLVLGRERLARAQLFEHVVHAGDGEIGMRGLLAFAVGVEFFCEGANTLLAAVGTGRERKGIEAGSLGVSRTVFQGSPNLKRPGHMNPTGEHPEQHRIIVANNGEHVVRQDIGSQKDEYAMFGCLRGDNVSLETPHEFSQNRAFPAEAPPESPN